MVLDWSPSMMLAIAITGLFLLPHAPGSPDSTVSARVARYLEPLARAGAASGAVLLARGDTVLYEGAVGWADRPGGRPMTPATPSAVASIVKPLTGIIADALIAQGKLSPEDRLARWFPEFPGAQAITIEMLRSHRAGIRHRLNRTGYDYRPQTAARMVPMIAAESLLFEPGTRRVYSSMGYVVLARILELVSGRPYWQLLDELVLDPAGASRSFDASKPGGSIEPATPYFLAAGEEIRRPRRDLSFLVGAGSLYSTPRDLFAVFRALQRGAYGAPARARQASGDVVWSGLTDGYRAVLQHDTASTITVVWVSNHVTGAGDWILRDLPRIARGEMVDPPPVPRPNLVALSDEARRRLAGEYQFLPNFWVPLEFVSPTAILAGEYLLLTTSDTTLFSVPDYAEVHVLRATDGRVTGLRWGSGNLVFPRRP